MTTLIAGIGNIFQRDDGFGSEVARRLGACALPSEVRVEDYGIRGVHLAFDLVDGCDLLVLVDALAGGDAPGTVSLLEPDRTEGAVGDAASLDAHHLDPQAVLATAAALGASVSRVLVVGCEPADLGDGIGLSPAVAGSVDTALAMIEEVVAERSVP